MIDKREMARSDARIRRALAKRDADQKASMTRERVAGAVSLARMALTDQGFIEFLRQQGIQSLPRQLVMKTAVNHGDESLSESSDKNFDDHTLEFVIAWTFFFPILGNPVIATELEMTWPGFTLALKDAFISLVVDGPFSQ